MIASFGYITKLKNKIPFYPVLGGSWNEGRYPPVLILFFKEPVREPLVFHANRWFFKV
jgi:hypothetical protein